MDTIIISSQSYLDQDIVDQKVQDEDFMASLSPAFEIDGQEYRVVLDGHHSLAAANQSGKQPEYVIQDAQDNDNIQMLTDNDIDGFLMATWVDTDYYNVDTKLNIF